VGIKETDSGIAVVTHDLTVVEKGPLVTPPTGLVVVEAPKEAPKQLLGPDGQPVSS
jgi:hypothetical protein